MDPGPQRNTNYMTQPTIYVASAGCGKTTALMEELESALQESTPEQIIFTTFTNAGAQEIANRAASKFPQFKEHQFRYFRTLHSIGYRNIPKQNLLSYGDYIQFSRETGISVNIHSVISAKEASMSQGFNKGDHLLHLDSLKRQKCLTWEQVAEQQELTHFSAKEIQKFCETFQKYRKKVHKYDFTDQLEIFLATIDQWNPPLTHLLVDEAQDLSPLQWKILDAISKKVEKVVIAGDDKQAIYSFNGGDPKTLINKAGTRKILETSYRLPEAVLQYSEKIASRIQHKQDYSCKSNQGDGKVAWIVSMQELHKELKEGTWFIIIRNRKFFEQIEHTLSRMGVLFLSDSGNSPLDEDLLKAILTWKALCKGYLVEAKVVKNIYQRYLRGADTVAYGFKKTIQQLNDDDSVNYQELQENFGLRTNLPWDQCFHLEPSLRDNLLEIEKNEGLDEKPRVRITTIHAVKGREADNVVLLPDLSHLTMNSYKNNPDEEHRVFYVGTTRAKKCLFLHQPLTKNFYHLPQP